IHNQVRQVKQGFDKACETIAAMQALAQQHSNFQFGLAATIFATNLQDAENILKWSKDRGLDIVFNMLRFTENMLNNKSLEPQIHFRQREEEFMRKFFLDLIAAMQALAQQHSNFQFGLAATIFATNLQDAENILKWSKDRGLDIVFNMLRFTENMLNNKSLEPQIHFRQREEEFMRKFFLDRVSEESVLSGQSFMYLHYADMIANGYQRTMPCPFQSQGLLLNPEGNLFYCENSEKLGNVLDDEAEALYFRASNLAHREQLKDKTCPTCLSPCQVNV